MIVLLGHLIYGQGVRPNPAGKQKVGSGAGQQDTPFPSTQPNWGSSTDEGKKVLSSFHQTWLGGLKQTTYQHSEHLSTIQGLLLILGLSHKEGRATLRLPARTKSSLLQYVDDCLIPLTTEEECGRATGGL